MDPNDKITIEESQTPPRHPKNTSPRTEKAEDKLTVKSSDHVSDSDSVSDAYDHDFFDDLDIDD